MTEYGSKGDVCSSVILRDTERKFDVRIYRGKEYPCSNDDIVIGLKARRLTQIPRQQPQDDCNGSQGKTYVMRNQDLTRLVIASMRKLILSFARTRNQRGQHFVFRIGVCCNVARACSNIVKAKSYL